MAIVIIAMISDLHLGGKLMSRYYVKVPEAPFFLGNSINYWDVMLKFGQDISFVAIVLIEMISDLHLCGKHMLRLVKAP